VTTAAAVPIATWRAPENSAPRPVSRLTAAPTAKRAPRLVTMAATNAATPPPIRYGRTGTNAPIAKATNDPKAAKKGGAIVRPRVAIYRRVGRVRTGRADLDLIARLESVENNAAKEGAGEIADHNAVVSASANVASHLHPSLRSIARFCLTTKASSRSPVRSK